MIQISYDPIICKKDIIRTPVIVHVNDIEEGMTTDFAQDFYNACNTGQNVLPITIDSYGGEIYTLMTLISHIENSPLPVITICRGKAMSAGAILLGLGETRYIDPNATVMLHDISGQVEGKNAEIATTAKEYARLNKLIFEKLAKRCGQSKSYFLDMIHEKSHAEVYLTPKQCLAHGLVDYVKIPKWNIDIKVESVIE